MRGPTSATETRSAGPGAGLRWSPRGVVLFLAAAAAAGAVTLALWAADYPYADLQRGYARMLAVAGVLTSIVLLAVSTAVRRATDRSGPARVGLATAVLAAGALVGWASGTALVEWADASDDAVEAAPGGSGPALAPPAATRSVGPAPPPPSVDAPITCDGEAMAGDVDGDGRVEIAYGATSAVAAWASLAVWHDGGSCR